MSKTRKNVPWSGWKREQPRFHQRTTMMNKCGKKCFLGSKKSFPICKKNTCRISKKGVYAAFVRSRQYLSKTGKRKYKTISTKAKRLLSRMK
jgi:hypothetical protein